MSMACIHVTYSLSVTYCTLTYGNLILPHWPAQQASGCKLPPGSPNHTLTKGSAKMDLHIQHQNPVTSNEALERRDRRKRLRLHPTPRDTRGLTGLYIIRVDKIGTGTLEGVGGDLWNSRGILGSLLEPTVGPSHGAHSTPRNVRL